MSRIRGIEVKVQKKVLQTRKYGLNEILVNSNNVEQQSSDFKDDIEQNQINELLQKLPKLDKVFEVHRKIGEGTFSSVYLGSLRAHGAVPRGERRWFAIKHLVPTAHPARVEHELRCLRDMGGKNHVIGVDLCLRHLDTIVFIMPYIPHRKFSEYVGEMDADEVRRYMRALLTALRHVHSFGVIHRDVKPSNFLYDRENRRRRVYRRPSAWRSTSACRPARARRTPRPRTPRRPTRWARGARAGAWAACAARAARSGPRARPAPARRGTARPRCCSRYVPPARGSSGPRHGTCSPRHAARYTIPRQVSRQGTAVDVWAGGVVLAAALSGRYPFLRAAGDLPALAELADLLGTRDLARAAHNLGRRIVTSSPRRGLCLRKLTARLRGPPAPRAAAPAPPCACRLPREHCICRDENDKPECFTPGATVCGFPDSAFSLAAWLLQADPRRRPSAADALRHPFLAGC